MAPNMAIEVMRKNVAFISTDLMILGFWTIDKSCMVVLRCGPCVGPVAGGDFSRTDRTERAFYIHQLPS